MTRYNCTEDVLKHKQEVEYWMRDFAQSIQDRARIHDDSKLQEPEKTCFDEWTPNLKIAKFGSDEYKEAIANMGKGLKHHYEHNRHHPEHYQNGIDGMTLIDVLEMLCDWIAASIARKNSVDLNLLKERFHLSDQLFSVFVNTLNEMDFWNEVNGVPVVAFTPQELFKPVSL